MFISARLLCLGILLVGLMSGAKVLAADVPNLRGTYTGVLLDTASRTVRGVSIPYIEQDSLRRLSGDMIIDGTSNTRFPIAGTVAASGVCTCIGRSGETSLVYQAQWEKLGNGAGGLFGSASFQSPSLKSNGTLFLFRPMTAGTLPKPQVLGNYEGSFRSTITGVTGSLAAQITDGTSNTFTVNLAMTNGRITTPYVCAGDVASDGLFVGMGVSADGSVAIIRGYIEQDNLRGGLQLIGEVQIKSAAGRPLDTQSIIAILIG
ncbi:MAG: hypothetical protein JNJ77_08980 [Planctomycetia bacterium]|nr:hypothetical protein [Planctomycetia bacterium]